MASARIPRVGSEAETELARLREWPENPRWIRAGRSEALKRTMLEDRAMLPVLSAGPTPHTPLDRWDFSIDGELDEPRRWTWEEFRALP